MIHFHIKDIPYQLPTFLQNYKQHQQQQLKQEQYCWYFQTITKHPLVIQNCMTKNLQTMKQGILNLIKINFIK